MGAFLARPVTDKVQESGIGKDFKYAVSSMQGWRVDMEDAHTVKPKLVIKGQPFESWSFFAVFDGHAGAIAAKMCSTRLIENILGQEEFKGIQEDKYDLEVLKKVIKRSFLSMDRILMEELSDKSGTTCTSLLITKKHFIFINCGDSRGFLSRSKDNSSNVHFSTLDHKPTNPEERQRIQSAGGVVLTQRINGSLAVSRALGDFDYKGDDNLAETAQLVSAEPDVTAVERNAAADQFICLACDGIFDVFLNEELADYINSQLKVRGDDLEQLCSDVIDTSLHKGSRDNMSIILLVFPAAPKLDEEIKKNDEKLNDLLRGNIDIICASHNQQRVPINEILLEMMAKEEIITLLPPGGGIHSKQSFIESLLRVKWPENDIDT